MNSQLNQLHMTETPPRRPNINHTRESPSTKPAEIACDFEMLLLRNAILTYATTLTHNEEESLAVRRRSAAQATGKATCWCWRSVRSQCTAWLQAAPVTFCTRPPQEISIFQFHPAPTAGSRNKQTLTGLLVQPTTRNSLPMCNFNRLTNTEYQRRKSIVPLCFNDLNICH